MRELVSYLIFGVLTTAINFAVYLGTDELLHNTAAATVIAWIISVAFAFITNKLYVFKSKSLLPKEIAKEAASFVSCRVLSGLLDLGIMVLGVDIMLINKMFVKIFSNVIVVVVNYVASKLLIFNKR